MKIYFAGSITGGRESVAQYQAIIEVLSQYGTVLTEHVGSSSLTDRGEAAVMTSDAIYTRDIDWLRAADLLVAEVTTPSLGVGYELGFAEANNIPTLCLFCTASGRRLSAMIAGNRSFNVVSYQDPTELVQILAQQIPTLVPTHA
ncbi:nucleoside 2-deoxyribosyltransferase [Candidatus Berkelbacteria bacterium]|nr:nucleoside 2-deoxyribosyltransferase [Candidatus Berkelbacteria bacterium]